ncbi:Uu.00g035840.m01.CDS01 [Anthostomella pinea]|uniref:Uu.00g035840.m01.CDS01 n=1 Tax=Anthostomella pinea TaxID=933095 RepID=A0AAI8YDE6_9PEZI|nr:Uu.00g035840.m01.CDS01 [Anthostomella pinea]
MSEYTKVFWVQMRRVIKGNFKDISANRMPAAKFRWELYRAIAGYVWTGWISPKADPFRDRHWPEDCPKISIGILKDIVLRDASVYELVDILWNVARTSVGTFPQSTETDQGSSGKRQVNHTFSGKPCGRHLATIFNMLEHGPGSEEVVEAGKNSKKPSRLLRNARIHEQMLLTQQEGREEEARGKGSSESSDERRVEATTRSTRSTRLNPQLAEPVDMMTDAPNSARKAETTTGMKNMTKEEKREHKELQAEMKNLEWNMN